MTRPTFSPRPRLPLRRESYLAAARRLRRYADQIEARADPQTPQERGALTSAIHGVALYAQDLSRRHRRSRE